MYRNIVMLLLFGVILNYSVLSFASLGELIEKQNNKNALTKSTSFVYDYWFFISDNDLADDSYIKSNATEVRVGQNFGFRARYKPTTHKVKIKVVLQVPNSPKNFPSHSGNVSIVGNTVTVNYEADGSNGDSAFYWGIGPDDPLGNYQLTFSIEGKEIHSYKFKVIEKEKTQ